ncbi:MAG TPA: lipase maturation factor family protein, partial [Acidimicrobiia bacterium]|nr:lipase maturation factor family protein [Acidimicrobiia bacterium]
AAMGPPTSQPWFGPFVARLLARDEATLRLLARDPFNGRAPTFVRARLFRYRFTTRAERRETGAWWARTPVGEFLPPMRLDADGPRLVRGYRV